MSSRDEGIIDVERRKDDAEHVLGDPTLFPPEYLNWLKRFIEQSGIQLPASSIFGTFSPGTGSVRNLAAGIILPFSGPVPPPGSLAANGASVARINYPALFEVIGTTYGAVDVNSFTLPDYRDRMLVGAGASIGLTQNDGLAAGSRGPHHKHVLNWNDPGHIHVGSESQAWATRYQNGSDVNSFVENTGSGSDKHIGTQGINAAATGISASVGPQSVGPTDSPAFHGVLYVITTG